MGDDEAVTLPGALGKMQRRAKPEFLDPEATPGANACPGCKCWPCKYEDDLENANKDLYELQQTFMLLTKEQKKVMTQRGNPV